MRSKKTGQRVLKCQNGFTLIEVMIAIALLSIGILGMATMQITSMKGNNIAGQLTEGSIWAMNRLEQIMALSYDDPKISAGTNQPAADSDGLDNDNDGQIDEAGESGNISIQWQVVDDYPIIDTKKIEITVTQGTGSAQKTVSLISYKMKLL